MAGFKSQAKRKRELAKLDKRHAKQQKRDLRKAERSGAAVGAPAPTVAPVAQPMRADHRPALATAPVNKPMTLAEAAERWRNAKVVKPNKR
jgi:hypothetical protein